MDSKGRILIPLEIRKLLHFESGEKFMFSIENGKIILLKSSDYDEFQREIKKFQQEIQKVRKTPISTEKLF
ncbi:AbrB/MazE/SpoVT family DNA-binding domain-containing protein [Candidatus Harpocratesius sp.]